MGNPRGVKRDFEALEKRRFEAMRLLDEGHVWKVLRGTGTALSFPFASDRGGPAGKFARVMRPGPPALFNASIRQSRHFS